MISQQWMGRMRRGWDHRLSRVGCSDLRCVKPTSRELDWAQGGDRGGWIGELVAHCIYADCIYESDLGVR